MRPGDDGRRRADASGGKGHVPSLSPPSRPRFSRRHVILPKEIAKYAVAIQAAAKRSLLEESEWRQLGVQQSRGWRHYAIHR